KDQQYINSNFIGDVPKTDDGMLETIILTQLIKDKNAKEYAILINSNITPVNSTVQTIRSQFFIVTTIMIAFALFLAAIISKIVAKPIVKINNASKRLAKGDYTADFETDGYREIAELGDTLNYASYELSKVDKLQKDLIANISHDLRTPLTMITGYAEVMRDLPGENTPENVQVVIDEAKRLTTLVNDVLDISKFQSGSQKLNIKEYNLTNSLKNIIIRYDKLLEQNEFNIVFINENNEQALINADETRICQVVYNLINNAITYTGEDKTVIVRQILSPDKKSVKIQVEDSGNGIEGDKLKDIWDRYYKVDNEHKRAEIGTGLGLSIVKSIIQLHGGRYGVKSSIGKGSVFWFSINCLNYLFDNNTLPDK
ncbi:MAG: HAMP domain-containing sensor histidine kinase, partial [Oscillospiraceae bacterium]